MPMPTISFLLGLVVLGYLSTFVLFAILRIVTGVSIQRIGYSGFRRIVFSPRNGIKINIRGVGLSLHRPTFALPTWCSLVITELVVNVDLETLNRGDEKSGVPSEQSKRAAAEGGDEKSAGANSEQDDEDGQGRLWRRLTDIKEGIKRLHRKIHWIRLVDFVAAAVTVDIAGVGNVRLERLTLSVDTRKQTVDRSRLFEYYKHRPETQSPAEWKSVIRSVLFTPEGGDSTEILDYATLNIHGMLHQEREGLRDASITLKLGRVNLPYDDVEKAKRYADLLLGRYAQPYHEHLPPDVSLTDVVDELGKPGSREHHIVRAVSVSRAFVASILRGIQEVQFAVGSVGLSRKIDADADAAKEVYFNFEMKELGLDILRLDPKSPAHKMYFTTRDVAHQGLLTGIGISAGIDDGFHHPERLFYIPMITATVKTTLPARTIHYDSPDSPSDRNTNILYANFVCTSPSVDLDPRHLPLLQELLKQRASRPSRQHKQPTASTRHRLISQLLPKANVKFSIEEPVVRISLHPMDKTADEDDFDLLISSMSSIALECESSHAVDGQNHYSLDCYYRHSRHRLYYQTAAGERHDLLQSGFVEVQVGVNAIPDIAVTATGRAQTFSLFLERPDICGGVRRIVKQLRKNVLARGDGQIHRHPSFLRSMPGWLHSVRLEGSDFSLRLAGIEERVSQDTRGFALELESWSTEYKAQRDDSHEISMRRKSLAKPSPTRDKETKPHDSNPPRKRPVTFADGRRLTVHVENLAGLVVSSVDESDPESFLSLPRFEIAFSTHSDAHGPIFHINTFAKSILLEYSLYHHFAIGVAVMVIKNTFLPSVEEDIRPALRRKPSLGPPTPNPTLEDIANREVTSIDFKASLLQIKARMPADPPMMIQVFGLDSGRHRWSAPFVRSRLVRLYARAPSTKKAWSRLVSVKVLRLDIRDLKRKTGTQQVSERSIDVVAETIRLAVPHSLVLHTVFDNITNLVKTTRQLHYSFVSGSKEYILTKEPEGPKNVPRITVRSQLLLFEIEDSTLDWKLGAIYRAGLLEQKQRLAREDAFKMKEKRLARGRGDDDSRLRSRSAHPDERTLGQKGPDQDNKRRSRSSHPTTRSTAEPDFRRKHRSMRYDAEGKCGFSDTSRLSIEQAREKLGRLNAQSWKSRIDRMLSFQTRFIRELRTMLWGMDDLPDDIEQHEPILAISQRPGLLTIGISDIHVTVDKPSFPIDQYPTFLNDVGKGMPMDTKYGLLVPMNLHITMSEARVQLRDYPLPLLHVPAIGSGQSPKLPALSMRTDFVVAEEFRGVESQRVVKVQLVPPEKMSDKSSSGFSVEVRRAISSIKTYSDIKVEVNTNNPTKLAWSASYQPTIQDTMQILEGFTKPPVDPSDRLGFWDKIRLAFHSRISVAWKGEGDVHLILKGSRDPYRVTGDGAGLAMVWRNDVVWNIARGGDPRKFMTVDSGEYILAVPDFSNYARRSQDTAYSDDASSTGSSSSIRDAIFKKVVMKLKGKVTWLAGLMFERNIGNGKRSFEFAPHYQVVLKHPDFAKGSDGQPYDAYRGFRSHHIHMSIAVSAPPDRDWSVTNLKPSSNYNSVHLTPRFFSHFFSWWHMFSGLMSLPIRQGPLWGINARKSKKFSRHIASIKYNLLLSPLFISHVYKHKDAEDYEANVVSATGLKMRLDSFMLDLHQRREYFDLKGREGARSKKSSAMRINQAQLDFISADLRAVSAIIKGTSAKDIDSASDETLANLHSQLPSVDLSKFELPDRDQTWIDMDDFIEIDWILPTEADPETKILPLGYSPRFSYFRQIDHSGMIGGDPTRSSPFGDEPTHFCVMSAKNDPRRVQAELIQQRLELIKEKKAENTRDVGAQELKLVQATSDEKEERQKLESKLETLRNYSDQLQEKHDYLKRMLDTLVKRLEEDDPSAVPDLESFEQFVEAHEDARPHESEMANLDSTPLADLANDFNNRFIVHNAQIKWNNSLRNIILRYINQNSQRRGFVYYMSRKAVKFILDVLEERKKAHKTATSARHASESNPNGPEIVEGEDEQTVQDRIEQLLQDGRKFVNADDATADGTTLNHDISHPTDDVATEFTPLNIYLFRLIAPQVQLQSEKNPKSAVLITAKGMQLKILEIMEKEKIDDDVSGLVQRRFHAAADSVQMFVTSTKTPSTDYPRFYSANRYGSKYGTIWPPWVPMEVVLEFDTKPYGFNRVVHRTSASLRYDKYNSLRLKYNDDISGGDPKTVASAEEAESRMDHMWLEFPHFRAICDSTQYFALYIMAMDLLLYSEPLEKTRSERLEKIMLASDFSDLTGAPEMVQLLQERIRQLEEIKMHFQVNEKYLDRQGWKDRIAMDQELAGCEDELFFLMKAITTSQQRIEDRREQDNAVGLAHLHVASKEIAWHLIRDKGDSLMEVQLRNASFDRTDNNDGSNYNCMEIDRINGYNLLNDSIYPEIIAPFLDESRGGRHLKNRKMLRIQWLMLEAIAGIPVVDYFEIDLVPLKLQVESDVAKKLFEYIFPSVSNSASESGFSPFMVKSSLPTSQDEDDGDEEDDQETTVNGTLGSGNTDPSDLSEQGISRADGEGPGALEHRLIPTLHLTKAQKKSQTEHKGLGISNPHGSYGLSRFRHSDRPRSANLSGSNRPSMSQTPLSSMAHSPSERSLVTTRNGQVEAPDKNKRFNLQHSQADDKKKKKKGKETQSDELTQMMNRASNYMTLAFVKIPSMVLCLSYKGHGKRNLEDVHDLVFRMPTLEYRNKTWSNLDLALQLKKEVMRALISHAGAIVGNKFSSHKPNRQQQSKLRELVSRNTFMSSTTDAVALPSPTHRTANSSETSSLLDSSFHDASGRPSTTYPPSSKLAQNFTHGSTPSLSGDDQRWSNHSSHTDLPNGAQSMLQESTTKSSSNMEVRPRTASITRRISGLGDRLRSRQATMSSHGSGDGAASHEDTEETKRKSRLLLGGQKLLGRLRDQ